MFEIAVALHAAKFVGDADVETLDRGARLACSELERRSVLEQQYLAASHGLAFVHQDPGHSRIDLGGQHRRVSTDQASDRVQAAVHGLALDLCHRDGHGALTGVGVGLVPPTGGKQREQCGREQQRPGRFMHRIFHDAPPACGSGSSMPFSRISIMSSLNVSRSLRYLSSGG